MPELALAEAPAKSPKVRALDLRLRNAGGQALRDARVRATLTRLTALGLLYLRQLTHPLTSRLATEPAAVAGLGLGTLPRFKRLLSSTRRLKGLLAGYVKVARISPYQIGGGVQKESVFFGRDQFLSHIQHREPANYLLVGGRCAVGSMPGPI